MNRREMLKVVFSSFALSAISIKADAKVEKKSNKDLFVGYGGWDGDE